MGIVDEIDVNAWLDVTLDIAPDKFQGQLRSPEVTDLGWTHNEKKPIGICLVGFPEVLNLNLWCIVPKNVSKPLLPPSLGQSSSFEQFEFWPLRRWRLARVMPFYLGALRMLNIAAGYSNNTILLRIERGTRWWRCQIATTHTYLRRYERVESKYVIFRKNLTFDLT